MSPHDPRMGAFPARLHRAASAGETGGIQSEGRSGPVSPEVRKNREPLFRQAVDLGEAGREGGNFEVGVVPGFGQELEPSGAKHRHGEEGG